METNDFNIYYLALTAVIALTPFLAILINQLLSLKSDMIAQDTVIQAKQANEISKQALEVAMFSYKGDIIPVIVGEVRWHLTNLKPYYQIYFNLHNKGRGPAIIESIKPDNDNFLIEELFDEETKIEQFGKNVTEIRDNR